MVCSWGSLHSTVTEVLTISCSRLSRLNMVLD